MARDHPESAGLQQCVLHHPRSGAGGLPEQPAGRQAGAGLQRNRHNYQHADEAENHQAVQAEIAIIVSALNPEQPIDVKRHLKVDMDLKIM